MFLQHKCCLIAKSSRLEPAPASILAGVRVVLLGGVRAPASGAPIAATLCCKSMELRGGPAPLDVSVDVVAGVYVECVCVWTSQANRVCAVC